MKQVNLTEIVYEHPQPGPKTDPEREFDDVFTEEVTESVSSPSMGVVFWELLPKLLFHQPAPSPSGRELRRTEATAPGAAGTSAGGHISMVWRAAHTEERELKKLVPRRGAADVSPRPWSRASRMRPPGTGGRQSAAWAWGGDHQFGCPIC